MIINIDSIAITIDAMQDADVRHPPELRRINIKLGKLINHIMTELIPLYIIFTKFIIHLDH